MFPGEGQASRNTWSLPFSPRRRLALQIGFDLPCPAFELLPIRSETTKGGGGAGRGPRLCGARLALFAQLGARCSPHLWEKDPTRSSVYSGLSGS